MKPYEFQDAEVQEEWAKFYPATLNWLKGIKAYIPEQMPKRDTDLEALLDHIMELNGKMTEPLAMAGQFRDQALAAEKINMIEDRISPTQLTSLAEGRIAQVTYLYGFAKNVWEMLERNENACQSRLKRMP